MFSIAYATNLEAPTCATPVIGKEDHGIRDRINGIIVPPNDVDKLGTDLNELLNMIDLERKAHAGNEGRRPIEEPYLWEKSSRARVELLVSRHMLKVNH